MRLVGILSVAGWAIASGAGAMSLEAQQALARAAAFAPSSPPASVAPTPFVPPAGAPSLAWFSQTTFEAARPNDSLTLATVADRVTSGAVLGPQRSETLYTRAYDLSYNRSWPSAFSMAVGRFDVDLSPHAGIGAGGSGASAEAGVMARFGRNLETSVARRLGVRDPASFNGQSRWYLFAASSGTAVGLNLLHKDGDWRRAGVTEDAAGALIGDTQAGFGWRKGPMAAALGYVHRDIKIRQGVEGLMGAGDRKDDRLALSFTIKQN